MLIGLNNYNLIIEDDSFYEIIYIFFLVKRKISTCEEELHEIFKPYIDQFGGYLGLQEVIELLDLLDIIESENCDSYYCMTNPIDKIGANLIKDAMQNLEDEKKIQIYEKVIKFGLR